MSPRLRIAAGAAALLAAGATAMAVSVRAPESAPGSAAELRAAPRPVELVASDLVAPQAGPVAASVALTGTLMARNQAVVKAKIAGEVLTLDVREGEAVRAGQVVARIDPTEAQARLREKLADVEAGRAQLAYAARNREQQEALLRQKFISENAAQNAESNWRVAEAKLNALEAQAAIARKALDDTVVRAPMNGVVAERLAQPGEKVAVDGKLLALVDLDPLEIEAAVPASDIPAIRIGQEVAFRVEGYEGREFRGTIDRIAPSTRAGTRSINVYALLPNRDGSLRAGMFAKGAVTVAKRGEAITLPATAIREDEAAPYVYAVADGRIARLPVTLGLRNEEAGVVEVSGLAPGTRVVRANLGALRVGAPVAVVPDAPGGTPR